MLKPLLVKLQDKRIILASSSKQRADILRSTVSCTQMACKHFRIMGNLQNLKFEVFASNFKDLDPTKHAFDDFVQKTALGKVNDVYERLKDDTVTPDIIIGADTMVAHEGKIFGKPRTKEEAFQIIKR